MNFTTGTGDYMQKRSQQGQTLGKKLMLPQDV